jgi:hypothetical protein
MLRAISEQGSHPLPFFHAQSHQSMGQSIRPLIHFLKTPSFIAEDDGRPPAMISGVTSDQGRLIHSFLLGWLLRNLVFWPKSSARSFFRVKPSDGQSGVSRSVPRAFPSGRGLGQIFWLNPTFNIFIGEYLSGPFRNG